jgi:hypothetical protein
VQLGSGYFLLLSSRTKCPLGPEAGHAAACLGLTCEGLSGVFVLGTYTLSMHLQWTRSSARCRASIFMFTVRQLFFSQTAALCGGWEEINAVYAKNSAWVADSTVVPVTTFVVHAESLHGRPRVVSVPVHAMQWHCMPLAVTALIPTH